MSAAIQIGATGKGMKEASKVILAILEAGADEATKVEALKTLGRLGEVHGTHIEGCHMEFKGGAE